MSPWFSKILLKQCISLMAWRGFYLYRHCFQRQDRVQLELWFHRTISNPRGEKNIGLSHGSNAGQPWARTPSWRSILYALALSGKNDSTVLDLVRWNGEVSLDVDGVVGDGVWRVHRERRQSVVVHWNQPVLCNLATICRGKIPWVINLEPRPYSSNSLFWVPILD